MIKRVAKAALCAVVFAVGFAGGMDPAGAVTAVNCASKDAVTSFHVLVNGSPISGGIKRGDEVTVTFTIAEGCEDVPIGLASYRSPTPFYDPSVTQHLYDSDVGTFDAGTHSLTVTVPMAPGSDTASCPNKHKEPEFTGNGANTTGAYNSNCDGSPSANGKGVGAATGRPCAGCVGNADDKNPPGQAPDGSDHNAGYECDRNFGIGKTNPAHTGCVTDRFFQIDFFYGAVLPEVGGSIRYGSRLIWGYNTGR